LWVLAGLEDVFKELPCVARAGDVVLFSPACASFDRYGNYRERGKHFQEMVEAYTVERGRDV
jgi:UDP-N-acetylmuramoylalanine--D-glutamate ligase